MTAYRILDEPRQTTGALAINPFWSLLAMMLAGAWLGAAMFAINACVLRGPTWRRECVLAVAILAGSAALLFGLALAIDAEVLTRTALRYALLSLVVWKLALAYYIFFLQQTAFGLHEYFAGQRGIVQQLPVGAILVGLGTFTKSQVVAAVAVPFWQIVVQ